MSKLLKSLLLLSIQVIMGTMAQENQKILDRNGFSLRYTVEGAGQDALVIGSSIYYPRTFSFNLRSHLRLIFMDHRGFSSPLGLFSNEDFELDVLVADIEALRKQLGLEKVILIGHSGHGYIALEYAKKHPENVSHLVLMNMSPYGGPKNFEAADIYFQESVCPERKRLLAHNLKTLDVKIAADHKRAFITRMLTFGPMIWFKPDYDAAYLWKGVEVVPEMFEYVWGKIFAEIDIRKNSEALHMPVFLALGRYDYWNPPHLWEPYRESFKELTIRVFEKSGHTPQLEESSEFDRELLLWLQG